MKRILVYINPDRYASLFDVIVAYDSNVDVVTPFCGIDVKDMRDIIYNCVFTRHTRDLKDIAIFIGGHDVNKGEELTDKIQEIFKELPGIYRVSVIADPDGAYTTASACVAMIKNAFGDIKGLNSTILAGTGPIGQSIAILLSKEGCRVTLTSRQLKRAKSTCETIKMKYDIDVKPFEVRDCNSTEIAISNADIVIATGPEGITILPRDIWSKFNGIKVMADVNAVPPYGIEDVDANDNAKEIDGKICFGALSIGNLKIKCHHEVIRRLFEDKGAVFGLEKVYAITEEVM